MNKQSKENECGNRKWSRKRTKYLIGFCFISLYSELWKKVCPVGNRLM